MLVGHRQATRSFQFKPPSCLTGREVDVRCSWVYGILDPDEVPRAEITPQSIPESLLWGHFDAAWRVVSAFFSAAEPFSQAHLPSGFSPALLNARRATRGSIL